MGPRQEPASGIQGRDTFRVTFAQHPSEGKGLKDADNAFLGDASMTAKSMLSYCQHNVSSPWSAVSSLSFRAIGFGSLVTAPSPNLIDSESISLLPHKVKRLLMR